VSISFHHCAKQANRDIQDVGEADLYQLSNKKGAAYEDISEVLFGYIQIYGETGIEEPKLSRLHYLRRPSPWFQMKRDGVNECVSISNSYCKTVGVKVVSRLRTLRKLFRVHVRSLVVERAVRKLQSEEHNATFIHLFAPFSLHVRRTPPSQLSSLECFRRVVVGLRIAKSTSIPFL
jgi:hypothetical protein